MQSPRLSPLKSIGPAIVVAAVVCGPGSILTASKVGAQHGYSAIWILALSCLLLTGMVALAARLGAVLDGTPGEELAKRLGRPVAATVGGILFLVIACFQSSNNVALVAGLEPLFGDALGGRSAGIAAVIITNAIVLFALYRARSLYELVEKAMKALVLLMVLAFVFNCVVAGPSLVDAAKGLIPSRPKVEGTGAWIALTGLVATTFSVAGAFYQAYLVRERGWQLEDAKKGLVDSVVGIAVLAGITTVILMTSAAAFYGKDITLKSTSDVAAQLEPLFGSSAKIVFGIGLLAGGLSSFLVNAMIGGHILADCLGLGTKMSNSWPRHLTAAALGLGMLVGILTVNADQKPINVIPFAQALTVIGGPALALALLYLATRSDLTGDRRVPRWIIVLGFAGFAVTLGLAVRTVVALASS